MGTDWLGKLWDFRKSSYVNLLMGAELSRLLWGSLSLTFHTAPVPRTSGHWVTLETCQGKSSTHHISVTRRLQLTQGYH